MKQVLRLLFVTAFVLFTSCEKEEEPVPGSSTAQDLQNGYWEIHFTSGDTMIMEFDVSTVTSYWLEGTPPCFVAPYTQDYTLDGNILTIGDNPEQLTVEIQDDILTLAREGGSTTFVRKTTLDYSGC